MERKSDEIKSDSKEGKRDSKQGKKQTLKALLGTSLLAGWAIKKGPKAWVRDHKKWLTFVNHCLFWASDKTNDNITGKYRFLRETIFIERQGKTALRFRGSDFKDRVFDFVEEKRANQWYNRCQKSIDIRLEVGFQFDKKGTVVDKFDCNLFFVDSNKKWKEPQNARVSIVTFQERGEMDVALLMDIFKKKNPNKVVDSKKRFLARRGLTPKNPNAWVLRGQDMDLAFNEGVFCVKMLNEQDRIRFKESFDSSWGNVEQYPPEGRISVFDEGDDEKDSKKKKKKKSKKKNAKPVASKAQNEIKGQALHQKEGVVEEQLVQWACMICTYLNDPNHLVCAMCRTQRPGNQNEPKAVGEQPEVQQQPRAPIDNSGARSALANVRTEQHNIRSDVRSNLPKSYTEEPKARQQPIIRSKLPEPVASRRVQSKPAGETQRITQQSYKSSTGRRSIPDDEAKKSDVPRSLTGLEQAITKLGEAVRDSESDNGSLEELYDQKEGDSNVLEVSPPNRRHLSVYSGTVEKDEELEWSSFEEESFEEEMTADFQRRIIGQTLAALKIKGGASCLSTLAEIANNLRFKDVRYRTIVTTGRKYKTRSFFIHKEAVGAIEALGFVPVGSQNEVFAWDPEFSALSVEEIIEAVDKPRKSNMASMDLPRNSLNNARSEMSFMTVDTEEINAIHDAFGDEDQRTDLGVRVMSE